MTGAPDGPGSSAITNHAFEPDGDWWETCRICGLAEAAHVETTWNRLAALTTTPPHYNFSRAVREAGDR